MPAVNAAPRARACSSPPPVDHGLPRRRSGAAGRMCSATSAADAANPPVASTVGSLLPPGSSLPRRRLPAGSAATRVSTSPRGSKRTPVVSGLPVSSATTGAPSARSHRAPSSSRSQTSRCSAASPPGHSRAEVVEAACRQTTPDDSSIEPPGARPALVHGRPRRRARSRARRRTARPCRRPRRRAARSGERERRLVLDVLDADAVGPGDEDGEVFGASTTDSTSIPSASARRRCPSADSTRRPRWFSKGRSAAAGEPFTKTSLAPPTSTEPSEARCRPYARRRRRSARGRACENATWSRS